MLYAESELKRLHRHFMHLHQEKLAAVPCRASLDSVTSKVQKNRAYSKALQRLPIRRQRDTAV